MNFLFAWRYFRAKKSTNAINIIAWVSMSAIVVGAASLILVLSVFNGFEDLVKSLYSSFYPDIKITPASGKTLTLTPQQLHQLTTISGVRAVSLVAEDKGILENGDIRVPAYLKGVDSNFTIVSGVGNTLEKGIFDVGTPDTPRAILGSGIEYTLGVEANKDILPLGVYLFRRGSADPMASMNHQAMVASGVFRIQQDFDDHYAITNMGFVKQMIGLGPNEYSSAELAVTDPTRVLAVKQVITQSLGNAYRVQTRYEQNQSLYNVMGTEKWVIYIVLTLILIVAAFNMVGALTMLVWEKQKDINVLKALGANNSLIQRIFLTEGLLLALMGGGGGMLLAAIICILQIKYKLIPLQGGSFLIDYYPVKLVATDFLMVFCTIGVVALLASWLPARKAANQPIALKT
ncbi:FtsX-like permease family protein [Puia dinghuensis]|uniref:Membrane protein n=1 Tax=Puia dinghuensis TaxID=1792502 RepID=A0A8J2XT13_9BACT|nr:FtsX-like permease family protein [Puia dinghuensis]GGB13738.1 membrane protein [Puia dinghuensis]